MKTIPRHTLLWAALLAMGSFSMAQLQLRTSTIDSGGGTSSGGTFRLTGTIGQPDAGPVHAGGTAAVRGGFWPQVVAVQMEGVRAGLAIAKLTTGAVRVSWPAEAAGLVLESSASLNAGSWSIVTEAGNPVAGAGFIDVLPNAAAPRRYFRLRRP